MFMSNFHVASKFYERECGGFDNREIVESNMSAGLMCRYDVRRWNNPLSIWSNITKVG